MILDSTAVNLLLIAGLATTGVGAGVVETTDVFGNSMIPPVVSIVAFIGLITIIWNVSKNYTSLKNDVVSLKERHLADMVSIAEKMAQIEKFFADSLNKDKLEWKEEVVQALKVSSEKFTEQQSQLTAIRSQLKDVDNRVTIVDTIVKGHTQGIKSIHKRVNNNVDFFTKWIQRVEDRVEKAQDRTNSLISDAKKELMGTMNMLINLSGQRPTK